MEPDGFLNNHSDSVNSSVFRELPDGSVVNRGSTVGCSDWWYDPDWGSTIATDWGLVCDKLYLVGLSQSLFSVGLLVGAGIFTYFSDKYGRKPVYMLGLVMMTVIGCSIAATQDIVAFTILRTMQGFFLPAQGLPGVVLALELFPAEQRTAAGTVYELFWCGSWALITLIGYLVRNWRHFQLAISLVQVFTFTYLFIVPESIHWLIINGKLDEAKRILERAARFNGKMYPTEEVFQGTELVLLDKANRNLFSESKANDVENDGSSLEKQEAKGDVAFVNVPEEAVQDTTPQAQYTVLDLLRTKIMFKCTSVMCFIFFVNAMVYNGLTLSTAVLAGDRFVNFLISGMVELPAYVSCIFILKWFGRRWPLFSFHVLAGSVLIATAFIPKGAVLTTLGMIGKFGISGSFATILLYTPELFPTTLRSLGLGATTIAGRVGAILSPFYFLVSQYVSWLPMVLSGIFSIVAACLALLLPETNHRPLANTVEDVQKWDKKGSRVG